MAATATKMEADMKSTLAALKTMAEKPSSH
jgi:hypothetical protein